MVLSAAVAPFASTLASDHSSILRTLVGGTSLVLALEAGVLCTIDLLRLRGQQADSLLEGTSWESNQSMIFHNLDLTVASLPSLDLGMSEPLGLWELLLGACIAAFVFRSELTKIDLCYTV